LCELLVAESYALTHREETLPFGRVADEHVEVVETILVGLGGEWRAAYQDFHGDQAEQLVAWLHVAGRRCDRYVDTARRLGSKAWMPIVALVESAIAAGNQPLALEVFRVADQPGGHRDHLRQRCAEFAGTRLDDSGPDRRRVH
jgi:hypothetical protein